MAVRFGYEPEPFDLVLIKGADFNTTVTNPTASWAVTASLEIRFAGGIVWTATRAGSVFTFAIDKAFVDVVIASKPRTAQVFYLDPPADLAWFVGPVIIK